MAYRIIEIRISPTVEFKLRLKHGLTGDFVREEVQFPQIVKGSWVTDLTYGKRLLVRANLSQSRTLIAYLYQNHLDPEVWHLGTAWVETRKNK